MKNEFPNKKLREFGILMGFIFPIVIGWILPIIFGHGFRVWTLWIGITFFLIGILNPELLFYPYKIWIKIGIAMGFINSRIILFLIFILVLQPIAFFMKFIGYDPLRTKKDTKKSYRELKGMHKVDLTRIF